jgi:hypothetical protein
MVGYGETFLAGTGWGGFPPYGPFPQRRKSSMKKIFTSNPKNFLMDKFIDESKESCLCFMNLNVVCWKVILLVLFTLNFIACGTTTTIVMPTRS